MRENCSYFTKLRVRFGEVDQQGIVYNGNYIVYTDVAFEDFLRHKGYTYKQLSKELDSEVCHRKTTIEFNGSAFEGDQLDIGVKVAHVGTRSFTLLFEIYREGEEEPIVVAESVFVGYDAKERRSKALNDIWLGILEDADKRNG